MIARLNAVADWHATKAITAYGDSFAVAASDLEKTRTAASYFGRHNERKYSVCRVDPIKGEYRCWRIA